MSYRETAIALAKRTPGNLVGVVLRAPRPQDKPPSPASWSSLAFPDLLNMEGWYEEVSSSPSYYYYVAVFDKTQHGLEPLVETTAPPQPGDPAWAIQRVLREQGYFWKPNPFPSRPQPTVSGEPSQAMQTWAPIAFIAGMIGLAWFTTDRIAKSIRSGK